MDGELEVQIWDDERRLIRLMGVPTCISTSQIKMKGARCNKQGGILLSLLYLHVLLVGSYMYLQYYSCMAYILLVQL